MSPALALHRPRILHLHPENGGDSGLSPGTPVSAHPVLVAHLLDASLRHFLGVSPALAGAGVTATHAPFLSLPPFRPTPSWLSRLQERDTDQLST